MNEKRLSRRGFLRGSAAVALGAAAMGIAGCSDGGPAATSGATDSSDVSWDKSAEVVVVGSGTAATAAVAASYYGAESVILVEKSRGFGGTSAMSGGGFAIPMTHVAGEAGVTDDSMEKALVYYKSASGGRADMDVVRSYFENGDLFLTWAEDVLGFTWGFTMKMYQDYYDGSEGSLSFGRGNISVQAINGEPNEEMAMGIWRAYRDYIDDDERTELMLETEGKELVVRDGKVVGIIVESGGEKMAIEAKKAVILGTGGFDFDDEMRKQYLPFPLLSTCSVETNTGDGHRMGMGIGAAVAYMDCSWGLPFFLGEGKSVDELLENNEIFMNFENFDPNTYRAFPGTVVVNSHGRRIGNEAAPYAVFNRAFGNFNTDTTSLDNIPAFFLLDSACAALYRFPGQTEAGEPMPSFFESADTLEELAGRLGIDPDGLMSEIEAFNTNALLGEDPEFGRGTHPFDLNTDAVYAGDRPDLANPLLAPLSTPPYYGAVYVPGTFGTCGGLKINPNAQVVDLNGEVIEGLYAVGNCSSGVSGGTYMHGGMTIGSGSVMSWVAARHILGVTE